MVCQRCEIAPATITKRIAETRYHFCYGCAGQIYLTRGQVAHVDFKGQNSDWDYCSKRSWCCSIHRGVPKYAVCRENGRTLYMHVFIMHLAAIPIPPGYVINHKDGDGFNNRRANLEVVTRKANTRHYWDTNYWGQPF